MYECICVCSCVCVCVRFSAAKYTGTKISLNGEKKKISRSFIQRSFSSLNFIPHHLVCKNHGSTTNSTNMISTHSK